MLKVYIAAIASFHSPVDVEEIPTPTFSAAVGLSTGSGGYLPPFEPLGPVAIRELSLKIALCLALPST